MVVIGILIALQVNNWNEERNTRQIERKFLKELKTDLEETRADLLTDMEKAHLKLEVIDSLYSKISAFQSGKSQEQIKIAMKFIYNRPALFPKRSAYESLQAFGINLVSNDSLRKQITDLYELHLVRVNYLEQYIQDLLEQKLAPHLITASKPVHDCTDCESLADQFSFFSTNTSNYMQINQAVNMSANYYGVEKPEDELVHLLKTNYMTYLALKGLYKKTETQIDKLIQTIEAETQP